MNPMKPFFESSCANGQSLLQQMKSFLFDVAKDPKHKSAELKPWGDLDERKERVINVQEMDKMVCFCFFSALLNRNFLNCIVLLLYLRINYLTLFLEQIKG
jgi:hypothetical protein